MREPARAAADGQGGGSSRRAGPATTTEEATGVGSKDGPRGRAARRKGQPEGAKVGAAGMPGDGRRSRRGGVSEPPATARGDISADETPGSGATEALIAPERAPEAKPDDADDRGGAGRRGARAGRDRRGAGQEDSKAGPAQQRTAQARPVPPPVGPARPRRRHAFALALLIVTVVLPTFAAYYYLETQAEDQFGSTLGFSVRSEEGPSATEVLQGIRLGGSNSSSDTDVLNTFIQSQDIVERIDAQLDLRAMYTTPANDPIFALKEGATVEELVSYWQRVVQVDYDSSRGLIEVRVLAFDPENARAVASAIYAESTRMINDLTAIAREDSTRYARSELEEAVDRLKRARAALTEFRVRTQIVDPNADIQGQMGLLNNLQAQLAEALIELDLLRETTRDNDPRIRQTEQRIAVIEKRIEEERAKFGIGSGTGASDGAVRPADGEDEAYATLIGEYESLIVDREFAENAYLAALTNFNAAQAEASRQSRYLAAHIPPTRAQSSEFPKRGTIVGLIALFSFMAWATFTLVLYAIKDRR